MTRTVKTAVRKNSDGSYELVTNVGMTTLSVMTQKQFEEMIRLLEKMRDDPRTDNPVYFPDFTYRITG